MENILNIYENAYCVITDRVHCTFPCLAFKTPVLFIDSASFGRERFEDIGKLVLMKIEKLYMNEKKKKKKLKKMERWDLNNK